MPIYWKNAVPRVPVVATTRRRSKGSVAPDSGYIPVPSSNESGGGSAPATVPVTGGSTSPFGPIAGGWAPVPTYTPATPTGTGGGGGGGGTAGGAQQNTGGYDLGPFQSVDQWSAQFTAEHGRAPNDNDWADFQDSVNFYRQTGRGPTLKEWKNRYYTGYWQSGSGGGWGGGGGGGGSSGYQSGYSAVETPGITWWNVRGGGE
jgi:hypothetical protein